MEKSYVGMTQCYFCLGDKDILLDRRLRNSLPRQVGVTDMSPCSECEDYMAQGIILISISDDTTEEDMKGEPIMKHGREVGMSPPNPYRTGGWCVVREEAVERIFSGDYLKFALAKRFCFIVDEAWDKLGLPRGKVENGET